jgi:oligoribonuclease NrnB/cAMP/cGMP phosphodiesterase (DHH superfamily)
MVENNTPKVLIYRHDDADGLWSAAIVYNHFKNCDYSTINIADIPVNYNKDVWDEDIVNKADYVYVLDFTFEDMDKLVDVAADKLIWIDHHKTAMEKFTDLWNSKIVNGIRRLNNSGCGLTWEYFYSYIIPAPLAIRYIEDRDLWKFKYPNTKPFCEAAYVKIKTIDDKDISEFLSHLDYDLKSLEFDYIEFGNARLEEQKQRVIKAFDRGVDITFYGHKARVVNTISDISEIGEYIYTKDEYDIAIMWYVDGNSVKCSLRSNSKDPNAPDCSAIAKKYKGGGHYSSAGYNVKIGNKLYKLFMCENE